MKTIGVFIVGLLIGLAISFPRPKSEPSNILIKEVPVEIPCEKVLAYDHKLKKDLNLPKSVSKDAKKHVVASTTIPNDGHRHTVTGIYDQSTGGVSLYDRQEPLPWISFDKKSRLAAAYGYSDKGETYQLTGDYKLMSIKRLNVWATGNIRKDARFGGIQIEFQF